MWFYSVYNIPHCILKKCCAFCDFGNTQCGSFIGFHNKPWRLTLVWLSGLCFLSSLKGSSWPPTVPSLTPSPTHFSGRKVSGLVLKGHTPPLPMWRHTVAVSWEQQVPRAVGGVLGWSLAPEAWCGMEWLGAESWPRGWARYLGNQSAAESSWFTRVRTRMFTATRQIGEQNSVLLISSLTPHEALLRAISWVSQERIDSGTKSVCERAWTESGTDSFSGTLRARQWRAHRLQGSPSPLMTETMSSLPILILCDCHRA